ncbi:hypothetical protein ACH347_30890 [Saccharopolyspora sp. 5N102]|uniref:hypothetical protein n=1 Tax=Saccharopolyspora sp. 5N102 TaxID=3375155 RepID=UPI0037B61EAF
MEGFEDPSLDLLRWRSDLGVRCGALILVVWRWLTEAMAAWLGALLSFGFDVGYQLPDREGTFAASGVLRAVGLPVHGEEEERRGGDDHGDGREHYEHSADPSALVVGDFSLSSWEISARTAATASKSSAAR